MFSFAVFSSSGCPCSESILINMDQNTELGPSNNTNLILFSSSSEESDLNCDPPVNPEM